MENDVQIRQAYIQYVLDNGARPQSPYAFARKNNLTEEAFYVLYGSFSVLERDIFLGFFEETVKILEQDKVYQTYGVRERVLALLYTWVEQLKKNRSFVLFISEEEGCAIIGEDYTEKTKAPFKKFARKIIKEGISNQEISDRMIVTQWYKHLFWGNARFVLNFWINDTSRNFEKTDAAIEKSVNFLFDLIQPNSLDSGFDFVKFLFQN